MREYIEMPDTAAQDTFNDLMGHIGDISELVEMLRTLGIDEAQLKGFVCGWALNEAGF